MILRLLDPSISKTLDPYSPEAVARLTLTNLRVRLLKAQTCPAPVETSSPSSVPTSAPTAESSAAAPYAVYTLMARGTCLCHGHAEVCAPHNGSRDTGQDQNTVSGFSSELFFFLLGPDFTTLNACARMSPVESITIFKKKTFLTLYNTCQELF